ncbi:MAG TPA: YdcF family protein, partial [Coleofasciculaceae cyanobacterium]
MRLIHRKQMWVLTAQGWLITFLCFIAFILLIFTNIHPFLAPYSPIKAEVLVVEGWINDYALKDAIKEFERGGYQKLITTG